MLRQELLGSIRGMNKQIDASEFRSRAKKVIENFQFETQFDQDFATRNYLLGDVSRFVRRLELINFVELPTFLEVGCGFGQWAIAAATLNTSVVAIDPDQSRIEFCKELSNSLGLHNIDFRIGGTADLVGKESFDAVFLFSVLPFVSWKLEISKIMTILNKGGKLYFNANDYGWMLFNLIKNPNVGETFSGREWAVESLENTELFNSSGIFNPSNMRQSLVIPKSAAIEYLKKFPGSIEAIAGDGMIDVSGGNRSLPFFPATAWGADCVYEVLFTLLENDS